MRVRHLRNMKQPISALTLLSIALTAAAPTAQAATISPKALPSASWAEVKLPYQELTALWQSTQDIGKRPRKPKSPPPMAALVSTADYELKFSPHSAELTARYQISNLANEWAEIPLLGGDARLDTRDTNSPTIAWRNDFYTLITRETGMIESSMSFALPSLDHWNREILINLGPAALNRLRITGLPEGKTIRIKGMHPSRQTDSELVYHFPAAGGEFPMTLDTYTPPTPPLPIEPSDWELQSEIFARYEDGRIHYECLLYATAQNGSGVDLALLLPRNAGDIRFQGDDELAGKIAANSLTNRQLNLHWATRDRVDRRFEVSYSIAQSPIETNWTLRAPTLPDNASHKSLFAIPLVTGLQLVGENLKRSIESRSLPNWLRTKVGADEFLTLEATGSPALEAQWLPQIKTAQATGSSAEFLTRLVADGSMLVSATCTIDHNSPLNWKLAMPPYEEILSCEVNGKRMQPIDREELRLEFPVSRNAQGPSKITFTYVAKAEVMDAVSGRLELTLPETDLFVHALKWQLSLPENYEPTAIEGNLQLAPTETTATVNEVHLIKQLVRQEAPAVEVYYQRRGLTN